VFLRSSSFRPSVAIVIATDSKVNHFSSERYLQLLLISLNGDYEMEILAMMLER
jgi:hypothetical protein